VPENLVYSDDVLNWQIDEGWLPSANKVASRSYLTRLRTLMHGSCPSLVIRLMVATLTARASASSFVVRRSRLVPMLGLQSFESTRRTIPMVLPKATKRSGVISTFQ
jgi:hypothetical protein